MSYKKKKHSKHNNKNFADPNPVIIKFDKDLISASVKSLYQQIKKNLSKSKYKFIFDMSEVKLISSSGFAFLLFSLRVAREKNGDVKLCSLKPELQDILKYVHFDLTFEIFDTVNQALTSYENKTEEQFRTEKRKRIKQRLRESSLEDNVEPLFIN